MGLSEVQVGLPLPPVILAVLRRLVGSRNAERLAVGGLLITPAEAAACGLVENRLLQIGLWAAPSNGARVCPHFPGRQWGSLAGKPALIPLASLRETPRRNWPTSPPGGGARRRKRHSIGWWSNSRSRRNLRGVQIKGQQVRRLHFGSKLCRWDLKNASMGLAKPRSLDDELESCARTVS
jgi:hypothetical protein